MTHVMVKGAVAMTVRVSVCAGLLVFGSVAAFAQGRGGSDWSTTGGDAHRSSWVRTDPKISPESLQKPGFKFMWKLKLQSGALSQPVLMDRYIGYRGFRSYIFVGDSANNVFALDSDLARLEWPKKISGQLSGTASPTCSGGMTPSVAERISAAFPAAGGGRGGAGGRGGPAKSGVGLPGEGAVTLVPSTSATPPPARGPAPGAAIGAAIPGPGRGRMPSVVTALSSDGALHDLYVSNGEEPNSPMRFLPANANASELSIVDDVAYAVTSGNCGGVKDGIWAMDLASKSVTSWTGSTVGSAFGPNNSVYVATAAGDLIALDTKTLMKRGAYTAGSPLTARPVVFEQNGKVLVAVAAKSGSIHVVDGATLTKVAASPDGEAGGSALATWQDSAGAEWILHGNTAWKLRDGEFQSGWRSQNIASPASAAVVNGVVFLATAGSPSLHATLYALDAASGKQLWSSGNSITSFISPSGGLAAGAGGVYLGTNDGTLWAFGFPIEH